MSTRVPPQLPSKVPCPIAFVGEAPGEEEIDKGRPLVGPSGRVFNAMLRSANLNRDDYLVTNVFDQKAEDNNVTPWMQDPEVYEPAFERLAAEIEAAQPTVIVPMGGTALWAFTGNGGIFKARGAVDNADRIAPGAKIVPTFHPAMIMRQWNMFAFGIGDFIKAAKEAERGPELVFPKRRFILEPTLAEFREYTHWKLLHADVLSVDIETGWGQMTCIGFSPDEETAITVPFVDIRKPNKSYWGTAEEEIAAWKLVKLILESPVPKLGQNFAAYDAFWMLDKYGIRTRNLADDTRLLHHALYPELPKDLATLGASYSQQGQWKDWRGASEKRDD